MYGKNVNGWWFFGVGASAKQPLGDLLEEYLNQTSEEIDEEVVDQGGEDEDDADDE
jgi:hypothetical protein